MHEQVPVSPISRTIQTQTSAISPKATIEEVLQSYSERSHRSHEKVIQRMTYAEALKNIDEERHKLFNDWLATKVKAKTEGETEDTPEDNFLKDMSLEYLQIQLDNFESIQSIVYKTYADLENMTLGELETYTQSRMDWYSSKGIDKAQRQNIRKILLLIRNNNNLLLAPCEDFKVNEFLSSFSQTELTAYATAVSKGEPILLTKETNIQKACLYGRNLHKLEEAFGKSILKKALTQKDFKDITDKGYAGGLISYYSQVSPTPFFQSKRDFWGYSVLRSVKKPINYYKEKSKLTHYIRNYHRFMATTLDKLKENYEDTGHSLPLILILHSGLDDDGAYVRDRQLDNLICNGTIKSLMIEGQETLDSISSLLPEIAGIYGPINQIMLAGHGGANRILLAGSFDASAKMTKVPLETNSAKSKEFIKQLLEQLKKPSDSVPGPKQARILLNACLTNSNPIPLDELSDVKHFKSFMDKINRYIDTLNLGDKITTVKETLRNELRNKVLTIGYKKETYSGIEATLTSLKLNPEKISKLKNYISTLTDKAGQEDKVTERHLANQSDIQNYIKAHPNLVAYIQSIIKEEREKEDSTIDKDAVQENIVYGANASITKPNLLKDGLLTLDCKDDPSIISSKLKYVENGMEPKGVFYAVMECWANAENELLTTIRKRLEGTTNKKWDDLIIRTLLLIIERTYSQNILFIADCQSIAEILRDIRLATNGKVMNKFSTIQIWNNEINNCFQALTTSLEWSDKKQIPLLVYQHWMISDDSKRQHFLEQLNTFDCSSASPYIEFKHINEKIAISMNYDLFDKGRAVLALLAIIKGDTTPCYKVYLNKILGSNTKFHEHYKIHELLAGRKTEDEILIAIGKKSSTPDLSSPEEPMNYMGKFHIKSVTLKGKIKNDKTVVFCVPEGDVEEGTQSLEKDHTIFIHGETRERYAIQHKRQGEVITVFVNKGDVEIVNTAN